jgi:transposase InsO family protein
MYWQSRFNRPSPDAELEKQIKAIRQHDKDFGYRRICGKLREDSIMVNHKKVQRLVQKLSLQVKSFTHKSRKYNSYKGTVGRIAPNRLHRRFDTCISHQKITTDTTEFKYYEIDAKGNITTRKAYLDPFLDLFNREVISFSITKRPSSQGIMSALERAIMVTSDCPYRRTFHSDQGWAYQMKNYVNRLKEERIFQSMSRKGTCLDNSVMENFFGLLKQEMYYGQTYHSFEELERAIRRYIEYYNKHRIKAKLGWLSPVNYRLRYAAA